MDPEIRRELEVLHALVKDNHHLLRKVRRHQILETFGRYVLWLLLLVLSYYAYVFYLAPLIERYQTNPSAAGASLFGLPTSADIQKLINSYKPAQ